MHHCCREKTDHQCKLLWAWPSTSTLQTTACAKEYMRKMVEDKDHQSKLQRVKNYTATIGVHDAPSTCNLHKGMPLNFCPYPQFNGICPYASLHMFAASCTPMVAVYFLTLCNLLWWSLSSTILRMYSLAHAVV